LLGKKRNQQPLSPPSKVGLCLPANAEDSLIEKMDRFLATTLARLIPEEKLNEEWNGLDRLVVFSEALSPQGKRKLLGFIAAGGTVATIGHPLGLPEEESIEGIAIPSIIF